MLRIQKISESIVRLVLESEEIDITQGHCLVLHWGRGSSDPLAEILISGSEAVKTDPQSAAGSRLRELADQAYKQKTSIADGEGAAIFGFVHGNEYLSSTDPECIVVVLSIKGMDKINHSALASCVEHELADGLRS